MTALISPFLRLLTEAAAGMPVILALGLVAGRRGHATFCVDSALLFLRLALPLSLCGPLYYIYDYLVQILPFLAPGASSWAPLFSPPGLPWLTSALVWLFGAGFLAAAYLFLRGLAGRVFPGDKYRLANVAKPLVLCLVAAAFFCACNWLINWPFAGFPRDLPEDRVIMAIGRHAMRQTFASFCPAGAIAVLMAARVLPPRGKAERGAIRWLAAWAIGGAIPQTIRTSGLALGALLHQSSGMVLPLGMAEQGASSLFAWAAILSWACLFPGDRTRALFVWLGFAFLLGRTYAAVVVKIFS